MTERTAGIDEVRARTETLRNRLFQPNSVAIVGASPRPGRATRVFENLALIGFRGPIYPVNPRYAEVYGLPCYPSLASISETVDCAVIAVSAKATVQVVKECRECDIGAAVVLASGFGESGESGRQLESELAEICTGSSIQLCGPNCHGVVNFVDGVAVSAGTIPDSTIPGRLALICQSGVLLGNLIDVLEQRGASFSYLVSTGNEAVLDASWYLGEVIEDPRTEVIGVFIEGVRQPDRFRATLGRAAELGKPVVVLKVGRSAGGRRAALSHTGSLTGEDHVFTAVVNHMGAIRVNDIDELLETVILLLGGRYPAGPLGVLTMSGAGSGLVADLADSVGVELACLSPDSLAKLKSILPGFATAMNPLDVTGAAMDHRGLIAACLEVVASDANVGAVAVAVRAKKLPNAKRAQEMREYHEMAEAAVSVAARINKPLLCFTLGGPAYDDVLMKSLCTGDVPFLYGTRNMLKAVRNAADYRAVRPVAGTEGEPYEGDLDLLAAAVQSAHAVLEEASGLILSEHISKEVLAQFGLPVTAEGLAVSRDQACVMAERIGFPVVLKVDSPDIPHKTEARAIRLNLRSIDEVGVAFDEVIEAARTFRPTARIAGVVVQEQVPAGIEMIVGARVDRQFGPIVMVGPGGIHVELLGERSVVVRLAPVTFAGALDMIMMTRASALLMGSRGQRKSDVMELARIVTQVSRVITLISDRVSEIDCNPVMVLPEAEGARVADALIVRASI